MSMTDPLADMLTRVRNAQQNKLYATSAPYSNLSANVCAVLKSGRLYSRF